MRPGFRLSLSSSMRLAGVSFIALAAAPLAPALAQMANDPATGASAVAASPNSTSTDTMRTSRAVGVRGKLKDIYWVETPEPAFAAMTDGSEEMRSAAPAQLKVRRKVWTARADVCGLPGEEILVQIRSPLTCGSLGCQMMVMSDAGGTRRVLMQTIGDTIDAPAIDQLTINAGSKSQRSWRYDSRAESASFRAMQ